MCTRALTWDLIPDIAPEKRAPAPFLPRLSLRAKGTVVLCIPMATLLLGLYALYRAESAAIEAEKTIESAYQRQVQLGVIPADA